MKTLLKIIGQKRTWLGSYCVIILIAILTNMIGYSVTKNMMLQNIEKDSINSLKNMQNIYDNYFQEALNSAYNVLQSPSVSKLSGDMPLSQWQKNDYIRNISTEMQNGMYGHRIMEECILIVENKDLCISSSGSMDIETAYNIYFCEYFENIADWEKELLNGYGSYVRTLMFKDKDFTENEIYEKLLNDKFSANLGYLYENAVAQTLVANGNELFYHSWRNETAKHNYEVDFLITRKNKICPIEVKSSGYKAHTSLDEFCKKFSSRISNKYIAYTKDLAKDKDILYLPMYMSFLL